MPHRRQRPGSDLEIKLQYYIAANDTYSLSGPLDDQIVPVSYPLRTVTIPFDNCLVQLRRDTQLASIMYRYSKNDLFVKQTANRENMRSEGKIRFNCIFSKVSNIRKSPFYRGVDLWNTLKVSHHRAENKKRFKSLLAQTWD